MVLAVLFLRFRGSIRGRYDVHRVLPEHDRVLVVIAAVIALGIAAGTVAGLPAWLAAGTGMLVLVGVCLLRAPELVHPARLVRLVPVGIVLGAFALFVLVELALVIFEPAQVDWPNDVVLAAAGAALSNVVNNLPAWLALAPITPQSGYPALLVGINVGGMLLLWGSLANLLWLRRCAKAGLAVSSARFAREGLLVVPLAVLLGALASAVAG